MKAEVTTWTGGDKERRLALAATQNTKSHMQVGDAIVGHVHTYVHGRHMFVAHRAGTGSLGVSALQRRRHKDTSLAEKQKQGEDKISQQTRHNVTTQHNTTRSDDELKSGRRAHEEVKTRKQIDASSLETNSGLNESMLCTSHTRTHKHTYTHTHSV